MPLGFVSTPPRKATVPRSRGLFVTSGAFADRGNARNGTKNDAPCQTNDEHRQTMSAALNVFQRLFQSWEAVHPYNAAQVVRWTGDTAPGRAAEVWGEVLESMGLGRVRVEARKVFH